VLLKEAKCRYVRLSVEQRARFRLHHVWTDEVFGELGPRGEIHGNDALQSVFAYSASKAASDQSRAGLGTHLRSVVADHKLLK
jgi:dTDP-glucose 4,6-dehydratase